MKHVAIFLILYLALLGQVWAEMSPTAKEAYDLVFKRKGRPGKETFEKLASADFPSEGHRTLAMIVAYIALDDAKSITMARSLAENYVATGPQGWLREYIRYLLVGVLYLDGQRKAGSELAMELLKKGDFAKLDQVDDPFLKYLSKQFGLDSIGFGVAFKDMLNQQIGYYYLNRDREEGGSDIDMAVKYFSKITMDENRNDIFTDYRLQHLQPPPRPTDEELPQSASPPSAKDSEVIDKQTPNARQPDAQNPWIACSVVVLGVTGIILLWFWSKKSK